MIGYNLYLIPHEVDHQTGEEWEGEPLFLYLSYGSHREAQTVADILEPIYAPSRIEIGEKHAPNTHMPGEGM